MPMSILAFVSSHARTEMTKKQIRIKAEARVEELEGVTREINICADHQIPCYAYADNEAGCDLALRLDTILHITHEALEGK
jgi:hypothetical protein